MKYYIYSIEFNEEFNEKTRKYDDFNRYIGMCKTENKSTIQKKMPSYLRNNNWAKSEIKILESCDDGFSRETHQKWIDHFGFNNLLNRANKKKSRVKKESFIQIKKD